MKALQAERDLRQAPNDPSLKTKARDASNAQRDARAIVDACAQDCRDAAARASMSQSAKSALDAEAGRAAVAATEAARRCTDIEKKANRAAARFAEASGRQSRDTFSEDGAVMTPLATDDRRALDAARDDSRLAKEALQAARATKECRALRARAARRLADDARQLQAEEPPPVPFDLGMQQPIASDSDGEFPEEAASPGMRKARRRIGRQKEEIHALRRLVCGGWMAQWRLLCELGEDPVPPREGGERGPGRARVDPATLADRFAEDILALDAATAQLAGGAAPDAEAAPYASGLAETLLQMEHASGCVRALAAIEVAPRTPAQLREQLDAASEPPEPLEQARVRLANLDPSALAQSDLDTMQRDLATMKQTLEAASERVQREVVRRELAALSGFRSAEEETCVICMDRSPNVTLVPCGHRITCQQCAERLGECPTCRSPITLRQRTFG